MGVYILDSGNVAKIFSSVKMVKKILIVITLILYGVAASAQNDTVGIDEGNEIFFVPFEVDPEFPGGIDALYDYICCNVSYPAEAREKGISGKVYVSFVVERDGSVTDVKVLRDIGGGCGEAVVEAVKNMPRWKPAFQGKKPVSTQFNLPVNFNLDEEEEPGTEGMSREEKCHYRYLKK